MIQGGLPRWMIRRVSYEDGMGYFPMSLFDYHSVVDHYEKRKDENGTIHHITQPYGPLTYDSIKQMVEICEEHGIEFDIRGDSDHYPGWTVMIEWRKKNEK